MAKLILHGFKEEEIKNISGKEIIFRKITLPAKLDCSSFSIQYRTVNEIGVTINSSSIDCSINPYDTERFYKILNTSVEIPNNYGFFISIYSMLDRNYDSDAIIEYEIHTPLKIFISETDRQNAYRDTIRSSARFLDIENWKTSREK